MKNFVLICTLLLSSSNILASKLIKCLAQEEAAFHNRGQQKSGPYYKLNQELISELIQLPDSVQIKKEVLTSVCSATVMTKSAHYLRLLNTDQSGLYSSSKNKRSSQNALDTMAIERVQSKSYQLLVNLLLNIQTLAKDPNCIYKKVPELKDFMHKVRFIQEDIGIKKIFNEIKNKNQFYKNLLSPGILTGC